MTEAFDTWILERLFSAASGLAMLSWLALALSPAGTWWAPRVRFVAGRIVPTLLAVAYVVLFAANGMGDGGYDSLASVTRLMAQPQLLVAGWIHYLAFDLFVGAWIAERAGLLGLPHLIVIGLLALAFTFGPAGLLAFFAVRAALLRRSPQAVLD